MAISLVLKGTFRLIELILSIERPYKHKKLENPISIDSIRHGQFSSHKRKNRLSFFTKIQENIWQTKLCSEKNLWLMKLFLSKVAAEFPIKFHPTWSCRFWNRPTCKKIVHFENLVLSLICSLGHDVVYKIKNNILSPICAQKMKEFDEKTKNLRWIFQGDPFSFHSNGIYKVKLI